MEVGLSMYEKIRKGRATRVQQASLRATENLNERIGFTSLTPHDMSLAAAEGELTSKCFSLTRYGARILMLSPAVNEMNSYKMHDHVAAEVGTERAS